MKVIETYQATHVDFDVKGAALYDQASITRRSEAIDIVQKDLALQGRTLDVWFTLPSNPDVGLEPAGLDVVNSAKAAIFTIAGVNIMTMDAPGFIKSAVDATNSKACLGHLLTRFSAHATTLEKSWPSCSLSRFA